MSRRQSQNLPAFALEFLRSKPAARKIVQRFHRWLKASYRPIRQLESLEVDRFLEHLAKAANTERARIRQRHLVLTYFDWLHAHELLGFDPRCAWPRSNFPLPAHAQQFLELLKPTHSRATVRGYQTTLRQFHIWLNAHHIALADLKRPHVQSWLGWLHGRGLAACTRINQIQQIRAYINWLQEHSLLSEPAQTLIRSGDLPKLPSYLPRPVAPDVDAQLQHRFKKSGCTFQLGLLLMRRTGLRIGELMNLPYRCIRTDHNGSTWLKVPLGKLATERLVPLDPTTLRLLEKLRRAGPTRRTLLLTSATGRKTRYAHFTQALKEACNGLHFAEPMTTHRLRHTYATSLLAAGMSLPAVMRLLGHRDYRMTLRYTAVTDSLVFAEFAQALQRNTERYPTVLATTPPPATLEPLKVLSDLVKHIQKQTQDDALDRRRMKSIVLRLRRVRADLSKFLH